MWHVCIVQWMLLYDQAIQKYLSISFSLCLSCSANVSQSVFSYTIGDFCINILSLFQARRKFNIKKVNVKRNGAKTDLHACTTSEWRNTLPTFGMGCESGPKAKRTNFARHKRLQLYAKASKSDNFSFNHLLCVDRRW